MIRSKGMKNLSATSIKKIRRMIAAVLAEPEFYDQDTFGREPDEGEPACGMICCGAGFAVWLDNKAKYERMMKQELSPGHKLGRESFDEEAMKALDLICEYEYSIDRLFGPHEDWPKPFCDQYDDADTPKEKAKVFAARWEKFIQTDGAV